MHTVTVYTEYPPDADPLLLVTNFQSGVEAHHYARELKNNGGPVEVTVTDNGGNTVELQQNGWSRA